MIILIKKNMTSNQSHKAIVFGSISIDKIVNKHGSFTDVLGGSAAYALLANQPNTCELVGIVGNDFLDQHFDLLSNHSISTQSLTRGNGNTFCWGGQYQNDFSSRRTLYVDAGVSESYVPELSHESKNYPFLLLGNTAPNLQIELLDQMECKPYIMLDTFKLYIDIANKELKELIKKVDLFCINYNEAIALTGKDGSNLDEIADAILSLGPKCLIIKEGENGSTYFDHDNNIFKMKAYPLKEVIDTTGAGDAYLGGILMGKVQGMNIFDAMKVGAVMASFCIEGVGAKGLLNVSKDAFQKRLKWMRANHTT
jgi:sugar/nucleoside kinase (ribokinase family)